MPQRIETGRLVLTPEVEQDAEWFAELLNARGDGAFTIDEARERIAGMDATMEATGVGALVLRTKPHGDPVGYCAIIVGRGSLGEPELAYELLPTAQGSGYATEASSVVGSRFRDRSQSDLVDCSFVERAIVPGPREARVPAQPHDNR